MQIRSLWKIIALELLILTAGLITYERVGSFIATAIESGAKVRSEIPEFNGVTYLGKEGVFFQKTSYDCGDAALKMIFNHFDIPSTYEEIVEQLQTTPAGTTLLNLREFARRKGLMCEGWRLTIPDLQSVPLPALVYVFRNHYAVLTAVTDAGHVVILDPARGRLLIPVHKLKTLWRGEILLFSKPDSVPARWFGASHQPTRRS